MHLTRLALSLCVAIGLAVPTAAAADVKWGQPKRDHCTKPGYRQYSAVLWGVPHGYSWEAACADAPIQIQRGDLDPIQLERPDVCVRATGNDVFK